VIYGIGVDIEEISHLRQAAERTPALLERVFTPDELDYCLKMPKEGAFASLTARFAAKEAFCKALGSTAGSFSWQEVEVIKLDNGQPQLHLSGQAEVYTKEEGIINIQLSLSHSKTMAAAFVVLETHKIIPNF
jgi:holo-[acyl-carrier protein] synthase